jgi:hypothetical protein
MVCTACGVIGADVRPDWNVGSADAAAGLLPRIKRAGIRLILILAISLAILGTLIWDGFIIFGAGRLVHLW